MKDKNLSKLISAGVSVEQASDALKRLLIADRLSHRKMNTNRQESYKLKKARSVCYFSRYELPKLDSKIFGVYLYYYIQAILLLTVSVCLISIVLPENVPRYIPLLLFIGFILVLIGLIIQVHKQEIRFWVSNWVSNWVTLQKLKNKLSL